MIHPLDGSKTPEEEDMSRAEAERLALRCVLKSEPEQTQLQWRQTA